MNDYADMMNNLWDSNPSYADAFFENTSEYEFIEEDYGAPVPKRAVFVRLAPGITDEERTFVANGIRNYFIS